MKLIVGNWKMNGLLADSRERAAALAKEGGKTASFQMVLCPPATLIGEVVGLTRGSGIAVGGQDCHEKPSGACTGSISAPMLKDLGCTYVILGHSERRHGCGEESAFISRKACAALDAGLTAIVCVGELESEREGGKAESVVAAQLRDSLPPGATPQNTVLAYEPVWAIGTGKTATVDDISAMHGFIRSHAPGFPILYGGSVNAGNAAQILAVPNVDGVLVGGASLKAEEFIAIARAAG